MSFSEFLRYIQKFILSIPFNIFDYMVFFALAFYVYEDASFGLVASLISFVSSIGAFFTGLLLYKHLSQVFVNNLSFTKGISDAFSFLVIAVVSFFIISFVLAKIRRKIGKTTLPKKLDVLGGIFFGTLSFFFISGIIVSLLLSFPVATIIKDNVRNSVTGRFLFTRMQGLEADVNKVFGGAINDTINFLTIKPESSDFVKLNFSTKSGKVDDYSEGEMLRLVNLEREKSGLGILVTDEQLQITARKHAKDMAERGYFSHYTPEGYSPFDRLEMDQVIYSYAGENLALAPDVQIAMDGLMKSKGHRENILSPNFKKAGIGVWDAGVYGKFFVQEFTD